MRTIRGPHAVWRDRVRLCVLLAVASSCSAGPGSSGDGGGPTDTVSSPDVAPAPAESVPPPPRARPAPNPTAARPAPGAAPAEFASDSAAREWPGRVAWTHPDSMYLGYVRTVRLVVSARLDAGQLEDTLRRLEPGSPVSSSVATLTDVMHARLGGEGFEIAPQTPDTQVISARRETGWAWQVRPLREGRLQLFLSLDAMYRVAGADRWVSVRQLTDTIDVGVSADSASARRAAERRAVRGRVGGFLSDHLEWLWTALVLPVGAIAWRRLRRRR